MKKIILAMPDILIVFGTSAISYGSSLIHPAAGFITGGTLALIFGVLGAIKGGK